MSKITAAITAIGGYVPDTKLTNFDLEKMVDTNDEWIFSRTGIKERRILKEPGKATSDMAVEAVNQLLAKRGISAEEIDFAIAKIAALVEDDFADETPLFIGVLNGAFMVVSDFMKQYKSPCEVSFIKMASYEGTTSTNDVKHLIGINENLEGKFCLDGHLDRWIAAFIIILRHPLAANPQRAVPTGHRPCLLRHPVGLAHGGGPGGEIILHQHPLLNFGWRQGHQRCRIHIDNLFHFGQFLYRCLSCGRRWRGFPRRARPISAVP